MLKKILSNHFVRGGAIYSIASFSVSILNYLFNLVVARNFSLSLYGEYVSALSYVMVFSVPLTAFSMVVVSKIGSVKVDQRKNMARNIESWVLSQMKSYFWGLVLLLIVLGYVLHIKGNLDYATILFIYCSVFLTLFSNLYLSSLQAFKEFLLAGLFIVFSSSLKLIAGLAVVFFFPTLRNLYIAIVVFVSLSLVLGRKLILYVSTNKIKYLKFNHFYYYLKRKKIILPLLATLGFTCLVNVDIILVKKFFDADNAGLFAALSLLGKIILYVSIPISTVAYSFFVDQDDEKKTNSVLLLSGLIFIFIGVISSIIYYYFPELVITIIFGPKYLHIRDLLFLSAIFGTFYSLVTLYTQFLISKQSNWAIAPLIAVVFQIILIYIRHQSLYEIMAINILVTGPLFLVLAIVSRYEQVSKRQ